MKGGREGVSECARKEGRKGRKGRKEGEKEAFNIVKEEGEKAKGE